MDNYSERDARGFSRKMSSTQDVAGTFSTIVTSKRFETAVAMGLVDGYSFVDKFGENPDVDTGSDPEDVWEGGGVYTYDANSTAPIISLASNDASDTEDIKIIGLDINGAEVSQTLTLTGTTRVAFTTPLWRVYRMVNVGTADLVGLVFCYTGTGTVPTIGDANIRALIDNGNNQTLMALYTIPLGKVALFLNGAVGISRPVSAGVANLSLRMRLHGKVFQVKKRIGLSNSGSSLFQGNRKFPSVIPALTDISVKVEEVSANDMGVWATYDIMLVDEDQFTEAFLTAISQPGH